MSLDVSCTEIIYFLSLENILIPLYLEKLKRV